jgi:hypothetical protein
MDCSPAIRNGHRAEPSSDCKRFRNVLSACRPCREIWARSRLIFQAIRCGSRRREWSVRENEWNSEGAIRIPCVPPDAIFPPQFAKATARKSRRARLIRKTEGRRRFRKGPGSPPPENFSGILGFPSYEGTRELKWAENTAELGL